MTEKKELPRPVVEMLMLSGMVSSRFRSHGERPGAVISSFAEDSPTRQALRELKSDDISGLDTYGLAYVGIIPQKFERHGRWNLEIKRCAVPGCMMLRQEPPARSDGTCGCHGRR